MKRNKGITLIALVVTIIILIILAGVSINLILGNNGIVQKAKLGKENMEIAGQEENNALLEFSNEMDVHIASSSREYFTETELWSGNASEGTIELSDDFTNYKSIIFVILQGGNEIYSHEYLTSTLRLIRDNEFYIVLLGYNNNFVQLTINKNDNKQLIFDSAVTATLYKVIGLK